MQPCARERSKVQWPSKKSAHQMNNECKSRKYRVTIQLDKTENRENSTIFANSHSGDKCSYMYDATTVYGIATSHAKQRPLHKGSPIMVKRFGGVPSDLERPLGCLMGRNV